MQPAAEAEKCSYWDRSQWNRFKASLQYYTGLPRAPVKSQIINYDSDEQFIELLHQGRPVVVVMCLKGHFARASERYGRFVHFVSVDCDKQADFCFSRGPGYFPTIELFNTSVEEQMRQSIGQGPVATYTVDVVRMKEYDHSLFGLRCFLVDNQALPPFVK